jgi:fluoride exporter
VTAPHPLHVSMVGVVALGGALGAVLRHGLATAFPHEATGFPWTTFAINVAGCVLLAGLELLPIARTSETWAAGIGPGLLGGFTTFSATSEQGRSLLADGDTLLAGGYLFGTLATCLVAVTVVGRFAPPLPREVEL